MTDTAAVELRSVSKRFGEFTAVNNVSLRIRDGEFFSLLGPSGCGKTTSLRMIAGFEHATAGEIYIGGTPQLYRPPFKRPVNTVFQNYALFPHMTVRQNVAFGLEMRRVPHTERDERVQEALDMVRLTGFEDRKPRQLSGGQQQRVALARALINRPKVLLLDEPLGALDLKLRRAMQLELKSLQEKLRITFIYVTHDQEEALTMSDRIAVMHAGRVLQVGSPESIYERPANRFVADFIGETNFMEGEIIEQADGMATVQVDGTLTVCAAGDGNLQIGQQVTVAVRPEKMSLSLEPPADGQPLAGIIQEVVYIGTDTRYAVSLAENARIVIRQQNLGSGRHTNLEPGTKVFISWTPGCARVLTS